MKALEENPLPPPTPLRPLWHKEDGFLQMFRLEKLHPGPVPGPSIRIPCADRVGAREK